MTSTLAVFIKINGERKQDEWQKKDECILPVIWSNRSLSTLVWTWQKKCIFPQAVYKPIIQTYEGQIEPGVGLIFRKLWEKKHGKKCHD